MKLTRHSITHPLVYGPHYPSDVLDIAWIGEHCGVVVDAWYEPNESGHGEHPVIRIEPLPKWAEDRAERDIDGAAWSIPAHIWAEVQK